MASLTDSNATNADDVTQVEVLGSTDGTPIGNVGDRLKVDAQLTSVPPAFSKKYRSEYDGSTLELTTSYQNRFTYSGSGQFIGFILVSTGTDITVKLIIDSDLIFELNTQDLFSVQLNDPGNSGPNSQPSAGGPSWDNSGKRYTFAPLQPISYATSVAIDVKKVSVAAANITDHIISLTKET